MMYGGNVTQKQSLFISDSTTGMIYYVDISDFVLEPFDAEEEGEEGEEGEEPEKLTFDAKVVGRVDGSTNVSSLFDVVRKSGDSGDSVFDPSVYILSENKTALNSVTLVEGKHSSDPEESVSEEAETESPETVTEATEEEAAAEDIENVVNGSTNAILNRSRHEDLILERNRIIFPEKIVEAVEDSGSDVLSVI